MEHPRGDREVTSQNKFFQEWKAKESISIQFVKTSQMLIQPRYDVFHDRFGFFCHLAMHSKSRLVRQHFVLSQSTLQQRQRRISKYFDALWQGNISTFCLIKYQEAPGRIPFSPKNTFQTRRYSIWWWGLERLYPDSESATIKAKMSRTITR